MITASLNVDPPLIVETLTLDSGARFLVLRCDGGLASVILPGFDAEAAEHARALAFALLGAADALVAIPVEIG